MADLNEANAVKLVCFVYTQTRDTKKLQWNTAQKATEHCSKLRLHQGSQTRDPRVFCVGMGQFGAAVSWNVKYVFLWNVTKVQKFALLSSGKRVSARVSLALVPDAHHGFGSAINAYSYTDRQPMARKCDMKSTLLIWPHRLTRFLFVLFYLCVCVSFFFCVCLCVANDLFGPWPAFIGCLLINNNNKVRYILRLSVKCNQNDTYVNDQAIDAVQA